MKNVSTVVKTLSLVAFVALLAGCSGDSGAAGATGASGEAGVDGTAGAKGDPGVAGSKGDTGIAGVDGATGTDGALSLLNIIDEPVGANCQYGGVKVESGIDSNDDGVLVGTEITQTEYICSDSITEGTFNGVVYTADKTIDNTYELYASVNGVEMKLAGPIRSSNDITSISVSPDKTKIAYLSGDHLYTVDLLKRSVPLQMHPDLIAGAKVRNYMWSPDGTSIAYDGDMDTDEVYELYVVQADGTLLQKVNQGFSGVMDVQSIYAWSSNSKYLAYTADSVTNSAFDLFVADLSTQPITRTRINTALAAGREIKQFSWNGNKLAYTYDSASNNVYNLYYNTYTAPTAGTETVVNGAITGGKGVSAFAWKNPALFGASKIAYIFNKDNGIKKDLYTYSLAATFPAAPASTLQNTNVGATDEVKSFKWNTAAEFTLAYNLKDSTGLYTLNTVPSNSAVSTLLHSASVGGSIQNYDWGYKATLGLPGSLDQKMIIQGDLVTHNYHALYAINVDGTNFVEISDLPSASSDVSGYKLAADLTTILYNADREVINVYELYSVDINGNNHTTAYELSGSMPTYSDVQFPNYLIVQP